MPQKRLVINLTSQEHEWLKRRALEEGKSVSNLVRHLLGLCTVEWGKRQKQADAKGGR